MKKKSIIVLLAVCVLALTGCNSSESDYEEATKLYETGDYEEAKTIFEELGDYEDSEEMIKACDYACAVKYYEAEDYEEAIKIFESIKEYEDSAEYIDNAEYKKILKSAEETCVTNEWYYFIVDDGGLDVFVEGLRDDTESNAFANEVCRLYDELKIDEQNAFERDFLEFYIRATCNAYAKFEIDFDEVSNVWKVGYDENNNVINGSGKMYLRTILVQIGEDEKEYPSHTRFIQGGTVYTAIVTDNEREVGFEDNKDEGLWHSEAGYPQLDGMPYKKVELNEVDTILTENKEIIDLLQECYERTFKAYQIEVREGIKAEQQEEIDSQNAEPEIGMTKSEVLNGAWGEPDKKNIDEYEWGTEEQWVYDGKGYVYFEDGVVTSIQHR